MSASSRRRAVTVATVLGSTLLLFGCAATVDGSGRPGDRPSVDLTSGTKPEDLEAYVALGTLHVSSAHSETHATIAGVALTQIADERRSAGMSVAMDLQTTSAKTEIVDLGGNLYAKLAPGSRPGLSSARPWLHFVAGDGGAEAVALRNSVRAASIDSVADFVDAADAPLFVATERLGGISVRHFTMSIEISSLPAYAGFAEPAGQLLNYDVWIDGSGRPVKTSEQINDPARPFLSSTVYSAFDAPVSVTAPPAEQVAPS